MCAEFRRIHTLDACHAAAKVAGMIGKQRVFKHIISFPQKVKKEMGGYIAGGLVITGGILPAIPTDHVDGFEPGRAEIFQMYIFQIAIPKR